MLSAIMPHAQYLGVEVEGEGSPAVRGVGGNVGEASGDCKEVSEDVYKARIRFGRTEIRLTRVYCDAGGPKVVGLTSVNETASE